MKKKILISSFISIVLLVVGIFFITSSHKKVAPKTTNAKGYCIVHAQGTKYPFEIAVDKYRTYLDAVALLGLDKPLEHIYRKVNKEWEVVDEEDYITKDEFIKID